MPDTKLVCRNVWKLFGDHADRVAADLKDNPDPESFAAQGLVAAVRDVNLQVAIRSGDHADVHTDRL